jgi:two-component system, chemotaxis family, CheB/CheR fusion protein
MEVVTAVGLVAAACTTLSYVPQLKKCWETGSAGDLSLRMFLTLATGVALWIGYGVMRGDWVIIAANTLSLALLSGILFFKLRKQPPAAGQRQATEAQALRRSEERYQAVVESTRDYAIFTTDRSGRIVDWYPGAAAVFGWPREEVIGQPADVLFVPEDRAADAPRLELETAAAKGVAPDVRWHQRKDGSRVFIEGKVVPIVEGHGPDGFLKIGQDVTARRRADRALRESEQHLQVLVHELQHRTRNMLSVVRSLLDSTMRETGTLEAFRSRFNERLSALSRAQSLLARLEDNTKLSFGALLDAELDAHGAGTSPYVTLDGPGNVPLKARQVQIFALALHELATNAVKHGALASPSGRLAVRWRVEDTPGGQELHVDWRESGLQTIAATAVSGYGRELIERALPYQLDARTSYTLTGDGVHCTISVRLEDDP